MRRRAAAPRCVGLFDIVRLGRECGRRCCARRHARSSRQRPLPLRERAARFLPHAMMGEGCVVAKTPHPFEFVGTPLCPLPQGERARKPTSLWLPRRLRLRHERAGCRSWRCRGVPCVGQRDAAARPANRGGPYFPGLDLELSRGVAAPSTLRSSSSAASIQVLAISRKTWRCRSDFVSPAHRKHSCANSRNSSGDAAMARSARETGGSATGLSATGACVTLPVIRVKISR